MTGIILQARMGSTRLAGKTLKPFGQSTLLEHILSRVRRLPRKAALVVATTDLPADDAIAAVCARLDAACYRGDSADVLKRYCLCAEKFGFSQIVRLTADNPFTDIAELARLIDFHADGAADLSHNLTELPLGVGAEIFTLAALRESHDRAVLAAHREHADEYILNNPRRFKIAVLAAPEAKKRPDVRLTIDTEEDYRRACFIAERGGAAEVPTVRAIALAEEYVRSLR